MTEHNEQVQVIEYLSILEKQAKLTYFAIPNGGNRDRITGAIMKREGVRAGIPDLCLIRNGQVMFIEMKRKGGRVSDNQKHTIARLNFHGVKTYICYGANEAIELINGWIK